MRQQSKNTSLISRARQTRWLFKDMKFPRTKYFLVGKQGERLKNYPFSCLQLLQMRGN